MLEILLITLLAILLGILIKHFYFVHKMNSSISWVDGPKPLPFIGNALELKNNIHMLVALEEILLKYNGMVKLSVGPQPAQVFVSDVELLKLFMTSMKSISKSEDYKFLHRWLNFGLLTSTGTKWQQRRKLITPTFHFRILEQFVDIFNGVSNILVKELRKEVGKSSFDIYPIITLSTLDVICESAMGIKVNALINKDSEYIKSIKTISDIVIKRVISPTKQNDFLYMFTLDSFKENKSLKIVHKFTKKVIRNRREELKNLNNVNFAKSNKENINKDSTTSNDFGIKKRSPFLDTLIQSSINGVPLSDDDIREEVDTFMFEGHDTTSSALSFTLYELSIHPDIQEKVYEEIQSIYGDSDDKILTYDDLQNMKYLEMVIKESMRLYTTVPLIGRELSEDMEYNGKIFPKGLSITLVLFATHRNPELYPEPHKFDPERFSVENQADRHPFAFVPFSGGQRNCIGQKFAMLEMKTAIAKILRHFILKPVDNYKPLLCDEMIIKAVDGIKVRIIDRKSK